MNIPTKKLKSGFGLPVYGLGLWQVGGKWEADTSSDEQEIAAIINALDAGITHVDTAESYSNGHAEELLGKAIKDYDRNKLQIATKVSRSNQSYDNLLRSFQASLNRIGTDYIDLYLLHQYPDIGIPIADTMRAMDRLVSEGVVKNIGVCNMSMNRFKEAQKHTSHKLVCNQVHYNVQFREMEEQGVLKYCQENDILLVAWRPLQKGMLPKSPLIDNLSKKYNKTPSQIAVNWLISQDHVVTLSKTSNLQHLHENLGAIGWTMEPNDVELIRKDFPDQKQTSDAVPLNYYADLAV